MPNAHLPKTKQTMEQLTGKTKVNSIQVREQMRV